jgi:S-adenosylmethionine:tRNA ribosyltransferase-isomerase
MRPDQIAIRDYTYELPTERIAAWPLPERDASKLLIYKGAAIEEDIFKHIGDHIPPGSLLIFNNTRVIEARILFQKESGASIEIFCLESDSRYAGFITAITHQAKVYWRCLVGGASKWKGGYVPSKKIISNGKEVILQAKYVEKLKDSFVIEFSWTPSHLSFAEILHLAGVVPLPPYIKRPVENSDATRYQTIYAQHNGSVAAPTAGLHFTEQVFETLVAKDQAIDYVTLHVGAGTFKPVKAETLAGHEMHAEFIEVKDTSIENIVKGIANNIIPIGTTSLRTIESLYWLGAKAALDPSISLEQLQVFQWDAYELNGELSTREALEGLLGWMKKNNLSTLFTKTQLLIVPGYKFRVANVLVTNFHQPQSTLLLLVAAFVGEKWKAIYEYALENDFRFLSYGDGCLLFRQ